jgi:hypothetical protein
MNVVAVQVKFLALVCTSLAKASTHMNDAIAHLARVTCTGLDL